MRLTSAQRSGWIRKRINGGGGAGPPPAPGVRALAASPCPFILPPPGPVTSLAAGAGLTELSHLPKRHLVRPSVVCSLTPPPIAPWLFPCLSAKSLLGRVLPQT